MRTRYLVTAVAVCCVLLTTSLQAQSTDRSSRKPAGIPKISCSIKSSADSLYFRGNDYVPNQITASITVTNVSLGADTAKNIIVCMVQDTRFNVVGNPCSDPIPMLLQGQSATITFVLKVASERRADGLDTVRAVAASSNGANCVCDLPLWVEHEYYPDFQMSCKRQFTQIVFEDKINDYTPNPFQIDVDVINTRDGASDSTLIQYLGTRGVSVDTTDPKNTSMRFIGVNGVIAPGTKQTATYMLRAQKRNNDTTVTLCFQVKGIGGYLRKNYIDSCCVDVFIPQAKQAVYDLICSIKDLSGNRIDSIQFLQHQYKPDPFVYEMTVTNNGTAVGRDGVVSLLRPPSIDLAPGETATRNFDSLATGQSKTFSWQLKPAIRFKRDTVSICVGVTDRFDNTGLTCCPLIIDSVRSADFDAECTVPDSIKVDLAKGIYAPDSFLVSFRVKNIGSDYADSVKATIVIQSPDVIGAEPFEPIKLKEPNAVPPKDTLSVGYDYTFTWMLKALPRAVNGYVTIKFKVEAKNAQTKETQCRVYIPKLDAPDLAVTCTTIPVDTVHFDPTTGGYAPPFITYTLKITNPGGGMAKNVIATLALPPRMLLAPGEVLTKPANVGVPPTNDLGPADVATVTWVLIPLERRDQGALIDFRADVSSDNVAGRFPVLCQVFVPALPYTLSLVAGSTVGYFGQTVNLPIFVDNPDGKSIKSLEMALDYNMLIPNLLYFAQPLVSYIGHVQQGTLLEQWNVRSEATSATHVHISASTPGAMLQYEKKPLLILQYFVRFGLDTNQLRNAYTDVMWSRNVLDSVRINNGSIFPRTTDGSIYVTGDCMRVLNATDRFQISQNRPNPFNPSTVFEYNLPEESSVRITVFDALGRVVRVLVDETKPAGAYSVLFTADNIPSGIYYYRMDTPKYSRVMKMILAR